MRKSILKIFRDSCILFTIFLFIVYGIGSLILGHSVTMALNGIAMLFSVCVILCIFRRVLTCKKMSLTLRILVHYLLVLGAAYLGFAVIGGIVSTSLQSLIMLSAITLCYSVFALVYVWLDSKKDTKGQDEYTSIFRK